MKKKLLKITGITLVVLIALVVALPFFLQGKIAEIIKNKVNNSINATLDFEEANLSLVKSFPNAHVSLKGIALTNHAPFEGDTLFASGEVELKMAISELFKGTEDPISIKALNISDAQLSIKVDEAENANYDVSKDTGGTVEESDSSEGFTLALESYSITNTDISYDDFVSGMHLEITEMNHAGSGDLSLETSELKTTTNALVSFELDSTRYLNKNKLFLDALIGIDLANSKYTFLENKALVNQLPLVFDGFVQVNEDNQEVDISFATPSSDFKNFLAVIPEAYSKNIENVQTTGEFKVNGEFKGIVDEEHIPKFSIQMNSTNASFKYPDLPQTVRNIMIDALVENKTGITEDTFVDIKKLSFAIGQDRFNLRSRITDLLGNTKVNAHADGKINLTNLSQAYPMPEDYNLKGLLNADVTTAFDMASVENKRYENTKTSGNMEVSGFEYKSEELKNPIVINQASMTFNPETVSLNSFDGKTGQSDFKASGTLTNILGYLFNEEPIEGNFDLTSNTFALNDFMVNSEEGEESSQTSSDDGEVMKIPSFLDCTINAKAGSVLYDNLNLKDVEGTLVIKDERAVLKNLQSNLFGGQLGLQGVVSTKEETPVFDMSLGMENFNIGESFQALELFKVVAPIASALQGKLNSDIKLSGNLKKDLTPNLTSLSGDVLAELLATQVNTEKAPLLSAFNGQLNFLDVKDLNLSDLKTALSFDNGAVKVKPFTVNYKDIAVNVSGSHNFEKELQYQATLDVPAKYLGTEVNSLIAQLDDSEMENLTIPVVANIGGNYTNPKVTTDLTSGVSKLTNQLVEIQKQKLLNKGKDSAKDLLSSVLSKENDSTGTKKSTTGEVLGSLLGKSEKGKDSTQAEEDPVKNTAKSLLGGLLGKKKKKDSVK
ncbi:AsmA-like C-terminal region-containing protein [Flagellimonas meridianipacifica]|uniref:AsmA-like protein n=1 Tax=Flagellimonas meridianipacifica TaxID=1080225 RepID=A0A2T0MJN0_9FLAO|nr:AsmA-like C-terminal region-containing protein [Allomuricauda pacifica]PRX57773.1 AsmA-like protein [Allomuricauda pacifica]